MSIILTQVILGRNVSFLIKHVIIQQFKDKNDIDIGEIYDFMQKMVAATMLATLYKVGIMCGYASARVECLFSAMTYIEKMKKYTI